MDRLLRAINGGETLRVVAASTTESLREACRRQQVDGVAAIALGRALTSGVLLATLAKGKNERVRIHLQSNGPLGPLVVDAHGDGTVRACFSKEARGELHVGAAAESDVEGGRPSIGWAVGAHGYLTLTRDLGLGKPYQGSVDVRTGEVDEDVEYYLDHSEQLPTVLRTEVLLDGTGQVLRSAGVLVQSFPGSDPELLAEPRERLAAGNLRALMRHHDREPRELVGLALGGDDFREMLEHPVRFHCPCGRARALAVLSTLGPADLEQLADESEQTEVRCNFCGDVTTLDADAVRELARTLRDGQS